MLRRRDIAAGLAPTLGSTPAEFDAPSRAQITKWQEIAAAAGISVD
jgi:hypothetical protein